MPIEFDSERGREFFRILWEESDRGCVLVASSHFEESLEALLRAHFQKVSEATDKELSQLLTDGLAPLQSFAVRTKLAYALGLIDKKLRKVLDDFRKVRNDFTHGDAGKRPIVRIHKLTDSHADAICVEFSPKELDFMLRSVSSFPDLSIKLPHSPARIRLVVALCIIDRLLQASAELIAAQIANRRAATSLLNRLRPASNSPKDKEPRGTPK